MTTTLLLLFFALLLSSTSLQFTESAEFEFPVEELVIPTGEQPLSGFIALDLSQAATNPQVQGLLYIGVQNATQQAIQAGYLPNGTYQVVRVNSIEQNQDITNIQDYRFDVDVSDGQGNIGTISFEITYDPAQGNSNVISYSVTGQETENEESFLPEEGILPGYAPLDPEEALTDPQIQGLLQIGIKNATEQAIQAGSLLNGTYYITQINSIEQNQDAVNVVEYRFDVNISSVNANNNISDLVFEITYDPSSGSSQVISYSISNIPTTETYTPLNLTALSTNPKIQGLIDVGAQNITQQAIQNGSLPSGTYQIDKVNGAGQGTLNPNNYQFNVSVYNNNGTTADALFNLTNKNISEPPIIVGYSITNVVTKNATTTVVTNTTTTNVTSNGLPKGYTAIDVDSQEAQKAYQVGEGGFYQIITDAMLNGKLPFSYYTLSSVNGAGKKVGKNGEYYWFDINVADGLGNSAELIFTMSYNTRTGDEKVLNSSVQNVVRAF